MQVFYGVHHFWTSLQTYAKTLHISWSRFFNTNWYTCTTCGFHCGTWYIVENMTCGGCGKNVDPFTIYFQLRPKKNICVFTVICQKNLWSVVATLSIFTQNSDNHFCCLISSNVLFIQPLAFCRNWEQRR
jgi:hypothetical protein